MSMRRIRPPRALTPDQRWALRSPAPRARSTGGCARSRGDAVGLGSLVPVALTVWAARELLLGRAGPLAWSTALWYAHGLFRDYNTPAS